MRLFVAILLPLLAVAYDSAFKLNVAQRYLHFCGASYCTNPYFKHDTVEDWSCKACSAYPHVNATSFHGSVVDANGFVGYDSDANEVIVAFSGTDPLSISNWIDDLDFLQTDYPYCSGCKVHEGFYRAYQSVAASVNSLVKSYMSAHPSATLAITGHSLGAALAAHCAGDLVHSGHKISTLYTFGMPRVGNTPYSSWYVSAVPGTFRVTHHKDPVPHVPFENWDFHHMPYEIFYDWEYSKWQICSFEGEDPKCSNQYWADLDVLNHLNYMDFDFTTNWLSCPVN